MIVRTFIETSPLDLLAGDTVTFGVKDIDGQEIYVMTRTITADEETINCRAVYRIVDESGYCFQSPPFGWVGNFNDLPPELFGAIPVEELTNEQRMRLKESAGQYRYFRPDPRILEIEDELQP